MSDVLIGIIGGLVVGLLIVILSTLNDIKSELRRGTR